jgi:hypothetical protein
MKKTRRNSGFRSWRMPPLGIAGVLAIVAALAVAGCGGSSGSSSSNEASSTGTSSEAAGQAPGGFEISEETRSCLQEQGVELPEPGQGGGPPEGGELPPGGAPQGGEPPSFGGAQGKKMQEAFKECGVEVPEGGQGKPSGAPDMNSAAFRESLKKYVACVRENGYELPEPNLSGEGPVFDESEVNQEDPKFKAASEKCQSLLGGAGGSGSSPEGG